MTHMSLVQVIGEFNVGGGYLGGFDISVDGPNLYTLSLYRGNSYNTREGVIHLNGLTTHQLKQLKAEIEKVL